MTRARPNEMKTSKSFGLILLVGTTIISGCEGGAIPSAYHGRFEGGTPAQQVTIDVGAKQVTVKLNENSAELKNFVSGFKDSVSQIESGQGGVFVLPAVTSFEGVEVDANPWVPRVDEKTVGLDITEQFSDRYSDVYVVVPPSGDNNGENLGGLSPVPLPITGKVNDFYAFVFHAQIDLQQQDNVKTVEADVVPEAEVSATEMNMLNLVKVKVLSISPQPADKPQLTHVSLNRTL